MSLGISELGKLSVRTIRTLTKPGRYTDGEGLHLYIRKKGWRQWVLRTTIHRKRVDIGLGSASTVSLAEARSKAREFRAIIKEGGDPRIDRARSSGMPTFEEAARTVYKNKLPTWKNGSHARQWIQTMEDYAFPVFGHVSVDQVNSSHILEVLTPLWNSKEETARRLKQRLKSVFDWAIVANYRTSVNPVTGIKQALPRQVGKVKHHTALPWKELPDFIQKLRQRSGISILAFQFLILTAGRSSDIRNAQWSEIDLRKRLWEIPAERMKMSRPHRVPLSSQAVEIVKQVRGLNKELLFPSPMKPKPLSDAVFSTLMKKMGYPDLTAHGFRSTFKDWCSEAGNVDWEVSELALAHVTGSKTERAYARSDLLEKRRPVMDAWSTYAFSKSDFT